MFVRQHQAGAVLECPAKKEEDNDFIFTLHIKRKYLCPNANYKLVDLPVGLNEYDHIRKLLTKIIWARYLARQQSAEK